MDFKNGVINIQAAGYKGAHKVPILTHRSTFKAEIDSFFTSMLINFLVQTIKFSFETSLICQYNS